MQKRESTTVRKVMKNASARTVPSTAIIHKCVNVSVLSCGSQDPECSCITRSWQSVTWLPAIFLAKICAAGIQWDSTILSGGAAIMRLFDLQGKTAIVTGGNKGLGLAMTEALCEAGATVVMLASSSHVMELAKELQSQGVHVFGVQGDLSDRDSLPKVFSTAVELLGGRLDILVNNAGIQRRNKAEEFSHHDWDAVLNVNLDAVFVLCQLAGNLMLAQGGGKIINVASLLSFFGGITVPAYAASKGAVMQLTKALSNEWAGRGICVNAIAPGYMDTPMNVNLVRDPKRNAEISARIPKGRWGTPEDMKGLIVFLSSSASDYICGTTIPVDGGYLAR
jgi:2-dehydro-3-deoxy-D-gluconate 5-dehydrogenase